MRYFLDVIPAESNKEFYSLCDMAKKFVDKRASVKQDYLVPMEALPEFKRLLQKYLKPELTYRYRYRGTRKHSALRLDTLKENATGAAFIIHYRNWFDDLDFQNSRFYLCVRSNLERTT